MNRDAALPATAHLAYREAGVDTDEAEEGLGRLVRRITRGWPAAGEFGAVRLPIGYFANVVDLGETCVAICTDGVGSKALVAEAMRRYDTIGVDCVAVNVNDLICVGARPVSMVDYIAVARADAAMLEAIAIGLADGAEQAGISICGGETAQLGDIVHGFDLAGTAIGTVDANRIVTGRDLEPGDRIIGLESSGVHSNGLTLARRAFFKRADPLPLDWPLPASGAPLGEELLRPTAIYVREVLAILDRVSSVKALVHVTSDGLLNLARTHNPQVGFLIDDMPPAPEIFALIRHYGGVDAAEMHEVYNMGVGFCVIVADADVDRTLAILGEHGRRARVIGTVVEDTTRAVRVPQHRLVGHGKRFRPE